MLLSKYFSSPNHRSMELPHWLNSPVLKTRRLQRRCLWHHTLIIILSLLFLLCTSHMHALLSSFSPSLFLLFFLHLYIYSSHTLSEPINPVEGDSSQLGRWIRGRPFPYPQHRTGVYRCVAGMKWCHNITPLLPLSSHSPFSSLFSLLSLSLSLSLSLLLLPAE